MTAPATLPSLRFGPESRFELQPAARRLLVDGRPAQLGNRALDMLLTLCAEPDRLVSKAELLDTVWPGLVVEESNLHVQMSTLRKLLGGDVIVTVPGRGYRFAAALLIEQPAVAPVGAAKPPMPASPLLQLVGRDRDLAALKARLQATRCLSLVGPGGVGKTSLARVLAARVAPQHVWVDLAALSDADALTVAALRACGQTLGEGDALPQLAQALTTVPLLVLDNAEHLTDAVAALIVALLASLPALHVLVTSQLALQDADEVVYRLDPLPLAAADGAQALLSQRITDTDHRVRLGEEAQPLLDAICRQLDGLPLALEMAATRVPALGLKRVHDELAHRFELLTAGRRSAAGRHRSLHAALDWSYGLLDAEEQRMFRALGLWAAGFTLDLAVAQMATEGDAHWDVIDRLSTLVDRSLVVASAEDPPRYRLLETMRAYALEQLAARGEEDTARRRQAQVLLACLRYDGDDAVITTPQRRAELENMFAALPWLLQQDFAAAAELSSCGATHDTFTRWLHQSSRWMETMESRVRGPEGQTLPAALHLAWWTAFARTLVMRRNVRDREVACHAVGLARAAGDDRQLQQALVAQVRAIRPPGDAEGRTAWADLVALDQAHPEWPLRRQMSSAGAQAHAASVFGDHEAALLIRRRELSLALANGSMAQAEHARANVLAALSALGRYAEMVEMAAEMLPPLEQTGGTSLPWVYNHYLSALLMLDRWDEFDRALPRAIAQAWQSSIFSVLEALMRALNRRQRWRDAARVWGLVQRLESGGDLLVSYMSAQKGDQFEDARAAFDEATLRTLHAEGAALDAAGLLALMRSPTAEP